MADAGFFKGTSADQDSRFSNKDQRLRKQIKFPPEFDQKVDMKKVELSVFKPWIYKRVTEIIGLEDEVVIEYVNEQLEQSGKSPDPKDIQIKLTGFLGSKTGEFMLQLWKLLLSAQVSTGGVPAEFIEAKKQELRAKNEADKRVLDEASRRQQHSERLDEIRDPSVEEEGAEEGVDGVVVRIVTGTPDGEEEAVGQDEIMVPQAEVVDEEVIRVLLHHHDTGLVLHLVVDVDLLHILAQGLLAHHHPGVPLVLQEVHRVDGRGVPGPQGQDHRGRSRQVKVQDEEALVEAGVEALPDEMLGEARRHRPDGVHPRREGEDALLPGRLHAPVLALGLQVHPVEGYLHRLADEVQGRRRHPLVAGLVPVRLRHLPVAGAIHDHLLHSSAGAHHLEDDLALRQQPPGAWDQRHLHLLKVSPREGSPGDTSTMKSRSRSPPTARRRRRSSSFSDRRSRSRSSGPARRGGRDDMRDGSTPPPPSKRARRDERSPTPDFRRGSPSRSRSRSGTPPAVRRAAVGGSRSPSRQEREDGKGKAKALGGRLGKSKWAKDEDDDEDRMDVDERREPSSSQKSELDKRESEAKEKLLKQKVMKARKPTS
ncbi:hypothetical protein FRC04_009581 [Tulasnella sp. 424]|nr:hypothetical protein FRC04_009581 [Tulasnella sp. 424]